MAALSNSTWALRAGIGRVDRDCFLIHRVSLFLAFVSPRCLMSNCQCGLFRDLRVAVYGASDENLRFGVVSQDWHWVNVTPVSVELTMQQRQAVTKSFRRPAAVRGALKWVTGEIRGFQRHATLGYGPTINRDAFLGRHRKHRECARPWLRAPVSETIVVSQG